MKVCNAVLALWTSIGDFSRLSRSGATYDSIEGRFRIIRKDAMALKNEVDSGARPSAAPKGGSSAANGSNHGTSSSRGHKASTPRKAGRGGSATARGGSTSITPTPGPMGTKKEKTISGRVSKSTVTSPTKSNAQYSETLALETDGGWNMAYTGTDSGVLTPTSLATNFKQESLSSHSSTAAASVYGDQQGNSHDEGQTAMMAGMDEGIVTPDHWDGTVSYSRWNPEMSGYGHGGDGFGQMDDGV